MTKENEKKVVTAGEKKSVAPVVGDTYSYKGWLNSDSFLKRAFAVYGYSIVAQIIVSIAIFAIMAIFAGGVISMFGN